MAQRHTPEQGFKDRRVDTITADIMYIGIVYMSVFGMDRVLPYFINTEVRPSVYWRLMVGSIRASDLGGAKPRIQ